MKHAYYHHAIHHPGSSPLGFLEGFIGLVVRLVAAFLQLAITLFMMLAIIWFIMGLLA